MTDLRPLTTVERHLQETGQHHDAIFPITHATGRTIDELIIHCATCDAGISRDHTKWGVSRWGDKIEIRGFGACPTCRHGTAVRFRWLASGVLTSYERDRGGWVVWDFFDDFQKPWWDLVGRIQHLLANKTAANS